jgi:hypothetical protein
MFTKNLRNWLIAVAVSVTPFGIGCSKEPTSPAEVIKQSFDNGDWNTVVSMCNQLLERNPDDADAILMRGRAYLGGGDLESAFRDFSRRIELKPEDPEGYYHRQIAYRELGQPDLAAADGERARRFDSLYKSAYAFEPSNFMSGVDLPSTETKPALDFDSIANHTAQDETVYSDEAEFEPDGTSRVLASGDPSKREDKKVSEGDIGIPRAPQIVHEDLIPKLADPKASQVRDVEAGDLAELRNLQFPANPTEDDPAGPQGKIPEITEPSNDAPALPELSTALPKDPSGRVFIPGNAPGAMSTGLQMKPRSDAQEGPENIGALSTGLNAPQTIATGLNAPRDVKSVANLGDFPPGAFSPNAINPNAINPNAMNSSGGNPNGVYPTGLQFDGQKSSGAASAPTTNIGLSGIPLPNLSTGLPVPSLTTSTNFAPTLPQATVTPGAVPFHGNPVYSPNRKPVISNSLSGYPVPNAVAQPVPSQPTTISTRLSDAVLQERLSRPTQGGTGASTQLRSLQQQ